MFLAIVSYDAALSLEFSNNFVTLLLFCFRVVISIAYKTRFLPIFKAVSAIIDYYSIMIHFRLLGLLQALYLACLDMLK